jgi:hypothetical protein
MLHDLFKKSCCLPIGVLASFLIPFRSVAQDVSPPISPVAKVSSQMVGDISLMDLPTAIPVLPISRVSPWLSNLQDSGTNLWAEAETEEVISDAVPVMEVSQNPEEAMPGIPTETPVPDAEILTPPATPPVPPTPEELLDKNEKSNSSLQSSTESEEGIGDSIPVMEVSQISQTNGANPEEAVPGVPTETSVPDAEIPAPLATPLEQSSTESAEDIIQSIRNALVGSSRDTCKIVQDDPQSLIHKELQALRSKKFEY